MLSSGLIHTNELSLICELDGVIAESSVGLVLQPLDYISGDGGSSRSSGKPRPDCDCHTPSGTSRRGHPSSGAADQRDPAVRAPVRIPATGGYADTGSQPDAGGHAHGDTGACRDDGAGRGTADRNTNSHADANPGTDRNADTYAGADCHAHGRIAIRHSPYRGTDQNPDAGADRVSYTDTDQHVDPNAYSYADTGVLPRSSAWSLAGSVSNSDAGWPAGRASSAAADFDQDAYPYPDAYGYAVAYAITYAASGWWATCYRPAGDQTPRIDAYAGSTAKAYRDVSAWPHTTAYAGAPRTNSSTSTSGAYTPTATSNATYTWSALRRYVMQGGYLISNESILALGATIGSAVGLLFRMLITSKDQQLKAKDDQIEALREERDFYRDNLLKTLEMTDRATAAAEHATNLARSEVRKRV